MCAKQPSNGESEEQLIESYKLFREIEGLTPMEVFSKKLLGKEGP